jgi:hypothetical protein
MLKNILTESEEEYDFLKKVKNEKLLAKLN